MRRARKDGLYLWVLGSLTFVLFGIAFEHLSSFAMVDFKAGYYAAKSLLEHGDPYNEAVVSNVYRAEHGLQLNEPGAVHTIVTRYIYLPSAFIITIPLALFPFGPAHLIWITATLGSLLMASFLMWDLASEYAPTLSGGLIGFMLANSEFVVLSGNPAGIALSLCVIAVWCFVRARFVGLGILGFAISLMLKPHDTGLVWLFFVLARGDVRKWALQTAIVALALSVPPVIWVSNISPHWTQELASNLAKDAGPGGLSDPGPSTGGIPGYMVNLQTVISFFRNDSGIYNPLTYSFCGLLGVVWAVLTIKSHSSSVNKWIGLAAAAALTLLPMYHRRSDALLLLLAVPGCSILWAQGGRLGRTAAAITSVAFVAVGDLTFAVIFGITGSVPNHASWSLKTMSQVLQVFPAPLALLLVCIFYIYAYLRFVRTQATESQVARS